MPTKVRPLPRRLVIPRQPGWRPDRRSGPTLGQMSSDHESLSALARLPHLRVAAAASAMTSATSPRPRHPVVAAWHIAVLHDAPGTPSSPGRTRGVLPAPAATRRRSASEHRRWARRLPAVSAPPVGGMARDVAVRGHPAHHCRGRRSRNSSSAPARPTLGSRKHSAPRDLNTSTSLSTSRHHRRDPDSGSR